MGRRQCELDGCTKQARTGGHCKAHGGGRRCQHLGCPKAAASGGTPHCIAHGGGKRCELEGCSKAVAKAPGSKRCAYCQSHGLTREAQYALDKAEGTRSDAAGTSDE